MIPSGLAFAIMSERFEKVFASEICIVSVSSKNGSTTATQHAPATCSIAFRCRRPTRPSPHTASLTVFMVDGDFKYILLNRCHNKWMKHLSNWLRYIFYFCNNILYFLFYRILFGRSMTGKKQKA